MSRRRGSERGMEEGSRFRVPESERVLVREATRSRSPTLDRLLLALAVWVLSTRVLPWRIAGLRCASHCDQ